jgi:hypothetical protein
MGVKVSSSGKREEKMKKLLTSNPNENHTIYFPVGVKHLSSYVFQRAEKPVGK